MLGLHPRKVSYLWVAGTDTCQGTGPGHSGRPAVRQCPVPSARPYLGTSATCTPFLGRSVKVGSGTTT
jgi:hypothetical protein